MNEFTPKQWRNWRREDFEEKNTFCKEQWPKNTRSMKVVSVFRFGDRKCPFWQIVATLHLPWILTDLSTWQKTFSTIQTLIRAVSQFLRCLYESKWKLELSINDHLYFSINLSLQFYFLPFSVSFVSCRNAIPSKWKRKLPISKDSWIWVLRKRRQGGEIDFTIYLPNRIFCADKK